MKNLGELLMSKQYVVYECMGCEFLHQGRIDSCDCGSDDFTKRILQEMKIDYPDRIWTLASTVGYRADSNEEIEIGYHGTGTWCDKDDGGEEYIKVSSMAHVIDSVTNPPGHGEACYFCKELCDSYAGNPSKWPSHFSKDATAQTCHMGCLTKKLKEHKII